MRNKFDLTNRELSIILGCLNDASGYPYHEYEADVKEKLENFVKLFDKMYKVGQLELNDLPLALLALKQTFNHMDQGTLYALQDDVELEEIGSLIEKLKKV